jgi:cyanophycinase
LPVIFQEPWPGRREPLSKGAVELIGYVVAAAGADTMRRRGFLAQGLGSALLGASGPFASAEPAAKSSGPSKGALLIIGGGSQGAEIGRAGREQSGGDAGRWVYIPTAAENVSDVTSPNNLAGWHATMTRLHTWDRKVADSEAFVAPLRSATAVYFEGGRQWRLVEVYGGTRTEDELRAVLDRGGLIAGTSAGATIQGSYLVRGSPAGSGTMMSPGHERGFGYLRNAAVDQHVLARGRAADMARVVAAHPGLLGIGIDEGTAALVQQNILTVIGRSVILITDGATHDGKPYYALTAGTRFDLASWTVLPAKPERAGG